MPEPQTNHHQYDIIIVGGGAAGYFAAIHAAMHAAKGTRIAILEATRRPLTKVKISGGGRCNVTHSCFDPHALVQSYPRGSRELRGPFSRFQPRDTVAFFEQRGVPLKTESDGRMFPVSDQSSSIIQCLRNGVHSAGVEEQLGVMVKAISQAPDGFKLACQNQTISARRLLLATGSAPPGHKLAAAFGHPIVEPRPSLFTFVSPNKAWHELSGLSHADVDLSLVIPQVKKPYRFRGPLLVTHWGFSGPAVLKLSAFAARDLFAAEYQATLSIDWQPSYGKDMAARVQALQAGAGDRPQIQLNNAAPEGFSKRLWQRLLADLGPRIGLEPTTAWQRVRREQWDGLAAALRQFTVPVSGKGEFKDEFVTAGGVRLKDVDMRRMESKIVHGLHFAGELLDVDGITGGFNFQNAWTTGYIAGLAMAESLNQS